MKFMHKNFGKEVMVIHDLRGKPYYIKHGETVTINKPSPHGEVRLIKQYEKKVIKSDDKPIKVKNRIKKYKKVNLKVLTDMENDKK